MENQTTTTTESETWEQSTAREHASVDQENAELEKFSEFLTKATGDQWNTAEKEERAWNVQARFERVSDGLRIYAQSNGKGQLHFGATDVNLPNGESTDISAFYRSRDKSTEKPTANIKNDKRWCLIARKVNRRVIEVAGQFIEMAQSQHRAKVERLRIMKEALKIITDRFAAGTFIEYRNRHWQEEYEEFTARAEFGAQSAEVEIQRDGQVTMKLHAIPAEVAAKIAVLLQQHDRQFPKI